MASCWFATKCSPAWAAPGEMWASEHFDPVPDILAVAKGIASGMPLGATVARADLMTWPPGAHASTFGGNPVACAGRAGDHRAAGRRAGRKRRAYGALTSWSGCEEWPQRFPTVGEVRGLGLMIGIELVRDRSRESKSQAGIAHRVVELAFERGLLILGAGENRCACARRWSITATSAILPVETMEECFDRATPSKI